MWLTPRRFEAKPRYTLSGKDIYVDKIVILTGHSEGSEGYDRLNALFTMLFPECKIQIFQCGRKALEMFR
jgi:hypothetical protein